MTIPESVRALIATGPPAYLTTLNADGSPQVTLVWIGTDRVVGLGSVQKCGKHGEQEGARMRPYSRDFRLKVVRAYERGGGSQRAWARLFAGSLSFVQDLLRRYRRTGRVEPKPHGGGNPGKIGPYLRVVQQLHAQQPGASLAERGEQFATKVRVHVGRSTMHRALDRLGLSREKRQSMPPNKTPRRDAKLARPSRS